LINQSGPSLVLSQMHVQPATCFNADGSITNISSQNATGTELIQWLDVSGNVVGNSFDLKNVPGGKYRLQYKDESNCEMIVTSEIVVPSPQLNFIQPSKVTAIDGHCGIDNGSITVDNFNHDPSSYLFSWIDKNIGTVIGTGTSISALSAGNYSLVAEDTNGCKKEVYSTDIVTNPNIGFDYSNMKLVQENCSLQNGGIHGISLTGAHGAVQYKWLHDSGTEAGVNANLDHVKSGSYKLLVTDDEHCSAESKAIEIMNNDVLLPPPVYKDIIIPRDTKTLLTPENVAGGDYTWYADAAGQQAIERNTSGIFETPVLSTDVVYYVKFQSGSCSSPLVPVKITVVDKTFFTVPNAFSPNNDGLNDHLVVRVFGHIQLKYFKIFNRYGQEVFSTTKLNDKWDGRVHSRDPQPGTYVWTAAGVDLLGNTIKGSGAITIVR
jgi:gliding motility-associated-like protein